MAQSPLHSLGISIGKVLDNHLRAQEMDRHRHTISRLSCGAAFESWLAFESRLLLEDRKKSPAFRFLQRKDASAPWFLNEHKKVDLFIAETTEAAYDSCIATVEFKLIHNNKNWPTQVEGIRRDLYPAGKVKGALSPRLGRLSVVGVVGAVFLPEIEKHIPGRRHNELKEWHKAMHSDLLEEAPACKRKVVPVWIGKPHWLSSELLLPEGGSYFQLMVLAA